MRSVVLDRQKVWSNDEFDVWKTLNKEVWFDGKAHGKGFILYEVWSTGGFGRCVEKVGTMSEAIDYCVKECGL